MADINSLLAQAATYLGDDDLEVIVEAYNFARTRHQGQRHMAGLPYIQHVLEVAHTLAAMHLDRDTIVAGLLHGILKSTPVTVQELEKQFGHDVANIVDGSTRITNVRYNARLTHQAENIRKLFLAMGQDIRVLLVKLADRLQDMLTLEDVDEATRRHVARETMDLYAPLASRFGIDWLKRELEDLAFRFLFPVEYADLAHRLETSMHERESYVREVIAILSDKLNENAIQPLQILGRPKHLYSIYKKIIAQNIPLERVYDKVAFRIIVKTVKECYEALGTVHANWPPVPGRIKDFISSPKANNYQSLHTTVIGPRGHFIEIQIRTDKMDRIAQEGVAAHWAYKEGQQISDGDARLFRELKKLVASLQELEDPGEFLDSVRSELFAPEVHVLTPDGEVRTLPQGATPIDFAYSIHSAVGDTCTGAKVNGQLVPLKYRLQNGDVVQILTAKKQHPKRAWLQLVKTSRARSRIRQWLRREEKERALQLGREICERELKRADTTLKKLVKTGHIKLLLRKLRCNSLDDLLVKVGCGEITLERLQRVLLPEEARKAEEEQLERELLARREEEGDRRGDAARVMDIDGFDDMLVKVSQCCRPVPGDDIVGFITTGSGISIHRADCPNLLATDPRRRLAINWNGSRQGQHRAGLTIRAENRKNLLADISGIISADDADIVELKANTSVDNVARINLVLAVDDLAHLQRIHQHLHQMPEVIEVRRR